MMVKILLYGMIFVSLAGPSLVSAQTAPPPLESPLFTITHTPNPAHATVSVDSTNGEATYYWKFRTEVHNGFDFPLHIVEFGADWFRDGQWVPNATPYIAQQFDDWYTAADRAPSGWLPPGATAADAANWNRYSLPVSGRSRWYFVGEDQQGQRYVARQEIELTPFVPETKPWAVDLPGTLIPLEISWQSLAEDLPPGSQVRLSRLRYPLATPYAVYQGAAKDSAAMRVRAPGMYQLQVFVPGSLMTTLTLVLSEDDNHLGLVVSDGEGLAYDPEHSYLAVIQEIQDRTSQETKSFFKAIREYTGAHGSAEGFEFDHVPFLSYLIEHMATSSPLAVRRYAAFTYPSIAEDLSVEQAQLIADLLPSHTVFWGADPQTAVRTTGRLDAVLDTQYLHDMAHGHPDRIVRGHAAAELGFQAWADGDQDKKDRYYEMLTTEFADLRDLDYARKKMNPNNRMQVGRPLPEFVAPMLEGDGQITNTTGAGQYRLLHFWATWCGPCKPEMKHVQALHDKFGGTGLAILSFSLDRNSELALGYQKRNGDMPWANAILDEGFDSPAAIALELIGIPRLVLVDPQGIIVAIDTDLRGPKMEITVAKFLEK